MRVDRSLLLVARREWKLLARSRAIQAAGLLLFVLAWTPPLLVSARGGHLGLASFSDVTPLALAVAGVLLPLLALFAGTDLLAGELEDRSLVPVLTLPISRGSFYAGKLLARGLALTAGYITAFGSVSVSIAVVHGFRASADYLVVTGAGWLLTLCCLGIGAALGAKGRGRVRAYATTLAVWLVLVFVLDAMLLTAVVATSPPAPESIGHHGHDELAVPSDASAEENRPVYAWMLADPVDLLRLSALSLGPELRARWALAPGASPPSPPGLALTLGWLGWILVPALAGWARFRRVRLL